MKPIYKTVVLKLSGEAIGNIKDGTILDKSKLIEIANVVSILRSNDVNVGIVCGAGNIFRGRIADNVGINEIDGDYMGMLGTIINCKAISSILTKMGIKSIVLSALEVDNVVPKYTPALAKKYLKNGYVTLFAGGIGLPQYTTDTCAATRAIEIDADCILAGKNGVDGVYDDDPNTNKDAKFIKNITYTEILEKNLKVMDSSAIELLKNKNIVTRVFSMEDINNFLDVVLGKDIGTTIKEG